MVTLLPSFQRFSLEGVREQGDDPRAGQISSHTDLCAR